MIHRIDKPHTKDEVLSLLDPTISEWFTERFEDLSPPQAYAIPYIHEGKNVLVAAPTGSGKTLTAFLSILNELIIKAKEGTLEEKIYCVYVSPLKALANDIERNLNTPLKEINEHLEKAGFDGLPPIRVAVRTGDTTSYMRQKMVRKPPHILITTPETLSLVLSTTKFVERLKGVKYMIVDEIHEISSSKRGVSLALSIERLADMTSEDVVRIGLSATQSPIEEIGAYLVGYEDGEMRDVNIVEIGAQKSMDLAVMTPVADMTALPFEIVNEKMYDVLKDLIDRNRTTLIFTNTRSGTEAVVHKLKERGIEEISAHHGSLSKEIRLEVEERLKKGEMKVVVTSTSLELGIDIGYVDLVIQIGSPKSIAKGIQRVGRAGHALHETSVGRIVVFEENDLVETMVLTKCAMENTIDRTNFLIGSLDVLAQALIGMSLERKWEVDDAYDLVRRSYPYKDLDRDRFIDVLNFAAGRHSYEESGIYGKIWYDPDEGVFGARKGTRMIYFMNIGTIPQEVSYRVFLEYGMPLGDLAEKFVERLRTGDIFLLGGKTYELTSVRGNRVYVKDAHGKKPTVPSWSGEMLPRTFDLSIEVGRFRDRLTGMILSEKPDPEMEELLMEEYHTDLGAARTVISYFRQQIGAVETVPTDRRVLIEGFEDEKGKVNVLFHFPYGRRVNDALSRAYAYELSRSYKQNVKVSLTDDNFMLTLPTRIELGDLKGMVASKDLEELLRKAIRQTELFKQRFRHTGARSMMILRNFKGHEISVKKQQLRSQRLLEALHKADNFPVLDETYNEILHDVMDLDNAAAVLAGIESGDISFDVVGYTDTPSPFGHSVLLAGKSDIVLMEDRSALLRELHRKVLSKVLGEGKASLSEKSVVVHYRSKRPAIADKEDILAALNAFGAMNIFRERGENIMDFTELPREEVLGWASELVNEGKVSSAWVKGLKWVPSDRLALYASVYARRAENADELLKKLAAGKATNDEVRTLEEAYLVGRGFTEEGSVIYEPSDVKVRSVEGAAQDLCTRYLEHHGPSVIEEIAFGLSLEEELVDVTLEDLERSGLMRSGFFIGSKAPRQYILTRDLISIERGGEEPVFSARTISDFVTGNMMREVDSIEEYFETFRFATGVRGIAMRVRDFDFQRWIELLADGTIIQGRFIGGQVSYVLARDAAMYVGTYRREELNEREMDVLRIIQQNPGSSRSEISSYLDLERWEVMDIVTRLDYNLYIHRDPPSGNYWNTINRYYALDIEEWPEEPVKETVRIMLSVFGVAPLVGIRGFLKLPYQEVLEALDSLEEEGAVTRIISAEHDMEMYVIAEYMKDLDRTTPPTGVRVLSLRDPFTFRHRFEVLSRFGDGWYSVVIEDSDVIGAIHMWPMSGAVDVRDILVPPEKLPELLDRLEHTWAYYRNYYMDVVRVKAVNSVPIEEMDPDVYMQFIEKGFSRIGRNLVKGTGTAESFTEDDINAYVLDRQHIPENKRFSTIREVLATMGGIRSEMELALRLQGRPISLDGFHRSSDLPKALLIPDYLTLTNHEDLPMFRAAKDAPLGPMMKHIYMRVPEFGISRTKLQRKTTMSPDDFTRHLKKLYEGLYVVKDARGRYTCVPDPEIEPPEARKWVVKRIFGNFGIFSAERLASYTKHKIGMLEIRRILRELEDEGILVKGLLLEDSEVVHWMIADDIQRVGNVESERRFVLSPKDQLFQYLHDDIKRSFGITNCYVVFHGDRMVAAFKAKERVSRLVIEEFVGEWPDVERTVEMWAYRMGLDVIYAA